MKCLMWIVMVAAALTIVTGCGVSQEDYDKTAGQLREALSAREKSDRELDKVRGELEEIKRSLVQAREENTRFMARIGELENSLAASESELAKNKEPFVDPDLQKKLETAKKKMSQLSSRVQGLLSENKQMANMNEKLKGLNRKLQGSLSDLKSQIAGYQKKINQMIQIPASGNTKEVIPEKKDATDALPGGFGTDLFK